MDHLETRTNKVPHDRFPIFRSELMRLWGNEELTVVFETTPKFEHI